MPRAAELRVRARRRQPTLSRMVMPDVTTAGALPTAHPAPEAASPQGGERRPKDENRAPRPHGSERMGAAAVCRALLQGLPTLRLSAAAA